MKSLKYRTIKEHDLSRLQHWLDYGLSSSVLFFLSYAYAITLFLALFAAALLTPLLLKVLIGQEKYGWLIFFIVTVGGPALGTYFLLGNVEWLNRGTNTFTAGSIALVFFYFYCGLLRLCIPKW